tara:strand:+ start:91 stop:1287 length:1197 start_codon:yes stop_codon:yes gene_type:complete
MAYDAKTQRLISLKKLAGKAQTSNDKDLANEGLPSGITLASNTVFGQEITTDPSAAALYTVTGQVEYIRFPSVFIAGSDTSSGRHGFELKLPSDYEANSSNSKAGTYPFVNNQVINITSGSLQLVPPSFATGYEAKPFYGGTSTKDSGTQIPVLDSRDWYLDYFNGVFFQQDPPGTGDHSNNPDYVEAYLYIGNMLDTVVAGGGGGGADSSAQYLVLQATGSLSAERVLTMGTGMSSSDAGAGGNYTLNIDNSVVATLTGSQFSGNVGITGSLGATTGLSGSLTRLTDGSSYLVAGTNVTISSSSNGQITIAATAGSTAPVMKIYEVTSSHATSAPLVLPGIDFSSNSRSFTKNQVFLNGVLMASGSAFDYTVATPATGSVIFNMALKADDIVIVRQT